MNKIALKARAAILFTMVVCALAGCSQGKSEEGWYLYVVDPSMPAVEQAAPFGSDKAKCEKFAMEFTKYARTNIKSSCVSAKQLAQLERERRAASKANF